MKTVVQLLLLTTSDSVVFYLSLYFNIFGTIKHYRYSFAIFCILNLC